MTLWAHSLESRSASHARGLAASAAVCCLAVFASLTSPVQAETFGPENPDGLVWSLNTFTDDRGRSTTALSYAIPETDAYLFTASCMSGRRGPGVEVVLSLDFGERENGDPVDVAFGSGDYEATYSGNVRMIGSEVAGIVVRVALNDDFWTVMKRETPSLTFHVADEADRDFRYTPLRGVSAGVQKLREQCIDYFDAFDASTPSELSEPILYECEDGSTFSARFDNSRSYSTAELTVAGTTVQLIQEISASGALYVGGPIRLHTKGDDAFLEMAGEGRTCSSATE
ncbi:MliC family protein [Stappia sp. ES.058]|uniref:MliC family protein n=1 Tax=Stappia sp. ES.058 TaxID=1881061 RepID=UPI00087B9203|nr:MliC family protein [Stappia sp. ES.058]SDU11191.1 Membrane-bound lysozyme-inhibitor of c-type lysozyme [Stappia sp. ES.058]